jgi:actin-like ATPase involved in cell morphogenesis
VAGIDNAYRERNNGVRVGDDRMDEAIASGIRRKHNLRGEK